MQGCTSSILGWKTKISQVTLCGQGGGKKKAQIFNSMGLRAPKGNGTPLQHSCLENPMDEGAWWAAVYGVAKSRTWLSNFTFTFHFHALEKEMATHTSVLAWRIPGTGSLMGCHLWGRTESDMTEAIQQQQQQHAIDSYGFGEKKGWERKEVLHNQFPRLSESCYIMKENICLKSSASYFKLLLLETWGIFFFLRKRNTINGQMWVIQLNLLLYIYSFEKAVCLIFIIMYEYDNKTIHI